MLRASLPLAWGQTLFALLSLADLALTAWLLDSGDGEVYEANPLARGLLAQHGLAGLACFKVGVVLLVLGLTTVINRSRPRAAGRILALGCITLLLVVTYSVALGRSTEVSPSADVDGEREAFDNREILAHNRRRQSLRRLMASLGTGLLTRQYTLRQAVARVTASQWGHDPEWLRCLALCDPGRPPRELIAAALIRYALIATREGAPGAVWAVADRLEREFEDAFGNPPPRSVSLLLPTASGPGPHHLRGEGTRDGKRRRQLP